MDSWLWNLAPLFLVKWAARRYGMQAAIYVGPDYIGTFHCTGAGGILVRVRSTNDRGVKGMIYQPPTHPSYAFSKWVSTLGWSLRCLLLCSQRRRRRMSVAPKPEAIPTHAGQYMSTCMVCNRTMMWADKRCRLCTDCVLPSTPGPRLMVAGDIDSENDAGVKP